MSSNTPPLERETLALLTSFEQILESLVLPKLSKDVKNPTTYDIKPGNLKALVVREVRGEIAGQDVVLVRGMLRDSDGGVFTLTIDIYEGPCQDCEGTEQIVTLSPNGQGEWLPESWPCPRCNPWSDTDE